MNINVEKVNVTVIRNFLKGNLGIQPCHKKTQFKSLTVLQKGCPQGN